MNRIRAFALLALVALFVAACGGESTSSGTTKPASADSDPNQLLKQAFSEQAGKNVKSAKFDLKASFETTGDTNTDFPMAVGIGLNGGIESLGEGKLPRFVADADVSAMTEKTAVGGGSTGEKLFFKANGKNFVVSDADFKKVRAQYEQELKGSDVQLNLATFGLDASRWLKDPRVAGEAGVAGTTTVKVTGAVDVAKAIDDVVALVEKIEKLGSSSGELSPMITPGDRQKVIGAIERANVEIYLGARDQLLRRVVLNMGLVDKGRDFASVKLDLTLSAINEPVVVEVPTDAKALDNLGDLDSLFEGDGAGATS